MAQASFIERWENREGGQERANYALFLTELCDLLGVAHPDPAGASHDFNDYVYERRVSRQLPDGRADNGRIDLYKRGCFILRPSKVVCPAAGRRKSGTRATCLRQAPKRARARRITL